MKWDEFCDLLSGIGPETPLGRMAAIRSENDKDVLKHFTKDQRWIRNEWRSRKAQRVDPVDMEMILEGFKQGFLSMAGK